MGVSFQLKLASLQEKSRSQGIFSFSLSSSVVLALEHRAAAEWDGEFTTFNVTQEAAGGETEREQRSGREEKEEENADGGFGLREDASKEHLSQRPAGSIIRERELEFSICVCVRLCVFLNEESGRAASVVTYEPASCGMNVGYSSGCSCFSLSCCACVCSELF